MYFLMYQVHEVEALRVREALSWIKERELNNVIIGTDSHVIVSTIEGRSSLLNQFGSIIKSCLDLLEQNNTLTLVFIRKQAHALAYRLTWKFIVSCYVYVLE